MPKTPPSSVKIRTIAKCVTITIPRHLMSKLSFRPNQTYVNIEVVDSNTILVTKDTQERKR